MTAVFSHGRLRLYLLKLLAEGPKHGYELIRLLENRFLGLYAPSAGTIYPRLARLENEGLVTHRSAGGRKTYEITDSGRAELAARAGELADLEAEIHASVADLTTLANDIEREVSGSVRDIKRELREASRQARTPPREPWSSGGRPWDWDWSGWRRETWRERARPPAGRPPAEGSPRGDADNGRRDRAASDADLSDLASALTDLAAEVHNVARRAGATDSDIRSATAVVVSALSELRRLLRR